MSEGSKELNYGKIILSDVVVKRRRNLLFGRKWRFLDVRMAVGMLMLHLLCLFAPFTVTWSAFWVAVVLCVFTGLGVTLSFHRQLSHHSFKTPKWLEYFFAYCGVHAIQRDPIFWVSLHRYHHQYVDTDMDPHSPSEGFWFSHIGWLIDNGYILDKYKERKNTADLKKQPFYMFLRNTYLLHPIGLAVLLYALGGFPHLVWGMGVRTVWFYHSTFFINSASHIWGNQVWNTGDLSKNNWWVALLSLGEGWHNNHHAFEYSARHGLEWWQFDLTWYVIRFLELVGLATNVKLPTEAHKQKKSFNFTDK